MCSKYDAARCLLDTAVYIVIQEQKEPDIETLISRTLSYGYFLRIDRKCLESVLNEQFSKVIKEIAKEYVKD